MKQVLSMEINHEDKVIEIHIRNLSNKNTLTDMYKILNCDCVTCTEIEIDGKYYDVWSDDCSLLKDSPIPTLYINEDLILFGNLLFAKTNKNGDTCGLSLSDVHIIYEYIKQQAPKLKEWISRNKG